MSRFLELFYFGFTVATVVYPPIRKQVRHVIRGLRSSWACMPQRGNSLHPQHKSG